MAGSAGEGGASVPVGMDVESAGVDAAAPVTSATAGRFAAIRAWVNTNMEKHEDFEKKG